MYLEEDGRLDFHCAVDIQCKGCTLLKLWEDYRDKRIITVPHHTSDYQHTYKWDFFNEKMLPIVELFQDCRGQHEQPDVWGTTEFKKSAKPSWVLDALKIGKKLGFIGSGDHSGIARGGVIVNELSREGLYHAFTARRAFASTGAGADIRFSCNGSLLGNTLKCDEGKFELKAAANANITEVHIVQNGNAVEQLSNDNKSFTHSWTAKRKSGTDFWYCRILLENGEIFWTSPIWLTQ